MKGAFRSRSAFAGVNACRDRRFGQSPSAVALQVESDSGWAVGSPDTSTVAPACFPQKPSIMDVVPNLRKSMAPMAICVPRGCSTTANVREVRVLRWTFRRDSDSVVCELGLNSDDSAYELHIDPPWNPTGSATELFNDAMSAFQRHAAIERLLVGDGWMLEGFESERVTRPA